MERLTTIAAEINKAMAGKFPYFYCEAKGGVCDSVYIALSQQSPAEWQNRIFENSPYLKAHVFVNGQREKPNSVFRFKAHSGRGLPKLRAKNNEVNHEKMADYVIKQLEKLVP